MLTEVKDGLRIVGFSQVSTCCVIPPNFLKNEQSYIFQTLAGILQLGNILFDELYGGSDSLEISSRPEVMAKGTGYGGKDCINYFESR